MPGIDATMLLQGLQPVQAPKSPLQSYAQLLGLQQQQQQVAAGEAEAKARQQAEREQQAVEAGYRAAVNPETGQFDENVLLANIAKAAPGHVPAVQKSLADLKKSAADAAKITADVTKAKDEHDAANLDYLAAAANAINQLPKEERAAAFGSTMAFLESDAGGKHDTSLVKQAQAQGRTVQQMIDGLLAASKEQRSLRTGEMNAQTSRLNAEKESTPASPFAAIRQSTEAKLGRRLTPDELMKLARDVDQNQTRVEYNELRSEMMRLQVDLLKQQVSDGQMSPAKFSQAMQLGSQFQSQTKDYFDRDLSYRTILSASQDPSPAGDLSMVFQFMKLLDPGSAVRETEQADARNAAGVPDIVRNTWNRLKTGKRLTPDQRADFINQANNIYKGAKQKFDQIKNIYDERARSQDIDPKMVTFKLDDPSAPKAAGRPGYTLMKGPDGVEAFVKDGKDVEEAKKRGAKVVGGGG